MEVALRYKLHTLLVNTVSLTMLTLLSLRTHWHVCMPTYIATCLD